jgi:hypothetical protein
LKDHEYWDKKHIQWNNAPKLWARTERCGEEKPGSKE